MNIPKIEEAKKKHLEEIEKTMLEIWQPVAGAWNPINTNPPKREWVGLTEEELYEIFDAADDGQSPCGVCGACGKCKREVAIAEAVEAKLKEKNT